MIVWLVFSLYPPYTGGAATYSEILVKRLANYKDIRKIILVTEYHRAYPFFEKTPSSILLRILPRRDSFQKRAHLLLDACAFLIWQILIFGLVASISIWRRGHILHLHSRFAFPWVGYLVRWLRCPAVVDVRDKFADPQWVVCFPKIIYVTKAIEKILAAEIPMEKLRYIPVPIDFNEIYKLAINSSYDVGVTDFFLFVGAMTKQKGVTELLEGYRLFRKSFLNTEIPTLVLAGPNYLSSPIPDAMLEGVVFLGAVPRESVYRLMMSARGVILPSKAEGMPRVCLEAIALHVPVLCPPDIEEFSLNCPDNVIANIEADSIKNALVKLYARPVCEKYPIADHDMSNCINRLHSIYMELFNFHGH